MLGTPKEEVKNKVLQMKLPVSEDVMKVLEITPEEIDDTKKNKYLGEDEGVFYWSFFNNFN